MHLFFLMLFIFFTGCATYQSRVSPARDLLVARQCEKSSKILSELAAKEDGDQLVHLLDYGSALQVCGEYKSSNQIFLKAEKLADEIDYHSVTRIAGATLLNEEMIQYKGDTFEKLFLNVSLALNFMQLGQFDDALVEVRKINQKFQKYKAEDKKNFELSPFSKYLSAMIWEADHKLDDACIDYRDAYLLDPTYRKIGLDTLRACWRAHRTDEFNQVAKKLLATEEEIKDAKSPANAELILIFMQGWGPRKQSRPGAPTFPILVSVPSETHFLKAEISDEKNKSSWATYRSEPVYSIEKAAINTLDADYNSLVARRIGARVTKEVLADQLRQKNQVLGNIAWLVMVASERADLRQWSIFPRTVHVIRIPVKPGQHTVHLTGLGIALNDSEKMPDLDFKINAGEKKIQLVRSLK